MTSNFLNLIAIAFYMITWVLIARSVQANIKKPDEKPKSNKIYFVTWGLALAAHLFSIINPLTNSDELSFSFLSLGSYVMLFIGLILFISTLSRKIQALAVIILPFSILSLAILLFSNSNPDNSIQLNSGLGIHILVSLLAYSTLMLAAVQAALLATQNSFLHQRLKKPNQSSFIRTLPALEDMEYFLFHLIGVGIILLSVSLLSGFYYLDNFFGSSVAHKTILSIISWVIFSLLLLGRRKYGWRGKTAVRWTISGFAVLALSFFGSKFIQEFVIDKEASNPTVINQQIVLKKTPPHFLSDFTFMFFKNVEGTYAELTVIAFNSAESKNLKTHNNQLTSQKQTTKRSST